MRFNVLFKLPTLKMDSKNVNAFLSHLFRMRWAKRSINFFLKCPKCLFFYFIFSPTLKDNECTEASY